MSWFLDPSSIALVGATERSLWSAILVDNLRRLGYAGQVHLVHPTRPEAFGQPCHPNLAAIPGPVDHAYVLTGTAAALDVLEDCGRKGVHNVTMLTAGFRETGPAGAELEERLVGRCRDLGIRLQGPNCLGFVNYHDRVPAFGLVLAPPLRPGGIALLSQSGAMVLQLHRLAQARGIGLAYAVSIGNEAMLDAAHFLDELLERPEVRVLGALLEGIRDPARFLDVADRALRAGKPLVVLKVGRGAATVRSVAAHTGSVAGADGVVDAAFRQHGVVRVWSLEDLVETCALLAARGWPGGPRTAVITTSGGACGLIADLAHGTRLELADFGPEAKRRLAELLPPFGTPQNPLDTTGVIMDQPRLLGDCIDAVVGEGGYDAVVVNSDVPRDPGPDPASAERRVAGLADAIARTPVFSALASSSSLPPSDFGRGLMERYELHFMAGLELGVRAVDHAIGYGLARARVLQRRAAPAAAARRFPPPAEGWSGTVPERDAGRLLTAYGIPVPEGPDARPAAPAVELMAGVAVDPQFGPVVVARAGGAAAEAPDDTALRLPPLDEEEALAMLGELRAASLLRGADVGAAAGVLVRLGELALDLGSRLRALDVNRLLVLPEGRGAIAADVLLILD